MSPPSRERALTGTGVPGVLVSLPPGCGCKTRWSWRGARPSLEGGVGKSEQSSSRPSGVPDRVRGYTSTRLDTQSLTGGGVRDGSHGVLSGPGRSRGESVPCRSLSTRGRRRSRVYCRGRRGGRPELLTGGCGRPGRYWRSVYRDRGRMCSWSTEG